MLSRNKKFFWLPGSIFFNSVSVPVNIKLANKKILLSTWHCFLTNPKESKNTLYMQMPFCRRLYYNQLITLAITYSNDWNILEYKRNWKICNLCEVF